MAQLSSLLRNRAGSKPGWLNGTLVLRIFLLLLAVALAYGTYGLFSATLTGRMPPIMDFLALYAGGQIIHQGQIDRLYDLEVQAAVENRLTAPYTLPEGVVPFFYPPFLGQVFSVLARLPLMTAYGLWVVLNLVLLACALWLLTRWLTPRQRFDFLLLVLAFAPLHLATWQGQTTFMTLIVLSAALMALRRGADLTAGITLGLGLFKPQLVLLPVLLLLWQRRWRAVLGFVGVALLLLVWSLVTVGWPVLVEGVRLVLASASGQVTAAIHPQDMPNLRGVFYPLAGAWRIAWLLLTVLLMAFLFWSWRTRPQPETQFAAAVGVNLLITPHLYFHDVVLVLVPLAVLLGTRRPQSNRMTGGIIGLSALAPVLWLVLRTTVPVVANLIMVSWMGLLLLILSAERIGGKS